MLLCTNFVLVYQEDMIILGPCKSFDSFLQSVSAISISRYGLFLIPSLLIYNKLSNEWSAIFVAQVLLLELKKICQKKLVGPGFERTLVRLFGDSN